MDWVHFDPLGYICDGHGAYMEFVPVIIGYGFYWGLPRRALFQGCSSILAVGSQLVSVQRFSLCSFFGNPLSFVIGGPLSGLLGLNGILGISGWRWLFILEEVPQLHSASYVSYG